MAETLDRIIYGRPVVDHQAGGDFQTLALSGSLTYEDATAWRSIITLDPLPEASARESQSVGIFAGKQYILARTHNQNDDPNLPIYEYVLLSRKLLLQAAGHIEPLLALFDEPLPLFDHQPVAGFAALNQPTVQSWTLDERTACFRALLDLCGGRITAALALLGAAIDTRGLLIYGFDGDVHARVRLVQGIMALLPAAARPELTFATYVHQPGANGTPRVIFSESTDTSRWKADFAAKIFPEESLTTPYAALLDQLWNGDERAFIEALVESNMDSIAEGLLPGGDWRDGLRLVAEQVDLNQRVASGADVPVESLISALSGGLTLPADVRLRYLKCLLHHALDTRNIEAALLVALEMDRDPALDMALGNVLIEALETQPDAVYLFVRTRLNDAMEMDERWLDRLEAAALVALKVAITDADPETIVNWLKLVSREPASYGLSDVLHQGILAAQERAHEDGELARQLILMSVKRDPETLDTLLNDEKLLAIMPENMGAVLRDYAGDPLMTLQKRGPEMFMVAMARSARAHSQRHFTPQIIEQLWKLYTSGQNFYLPAHYRPESVIETWLDSGAEWLSDESRTAILTLMLADSRDELFYQFAHHLAEHEALTVPLLVDALQNSQRSVSDILLLIGRITASGDLTQQEAVNTYVDLLNLREWRQAALPLVEQLARMIQQHSTLDVSPETVWQLLDVAARSKSENIARVAARQLFNDIEQHADGDAEVNMDEVLVEVLTRLLEQLQWSSNAPQFVMNWWRDFVRQQPVARLGRIDKLIESKGSKLLDETRTILQTTLAFRRMLGKRAIQDFARALDTAFGILQDITESFDPSTRRPVSFDEDTIRAELDTRQEELTEDERRILAKNFKELAQLIGEMGDHRSKANIMRRGDNIDRQLMTGEQQPASAVDAMKWMAGYLDGIQDQAKDEDE